MLTSITVENFRGIERLKLERLGRVNLVIGRNDCGKTALLEAVNIVSMPEDAGHMVAVTQATRIVPQSEEDTIEDFESFWRPVFREGNATRGFALAATSEQGAEARLVFRMARIPVPTVMSDILAGPSSKGSWVLEYDVSRPAGTTRFEITRGVKGVILPGGPGEFFAVPTGAIDEMPLMSSLSLLKQQSKEEQLVELLHNIDPRIRGFEILALKEGRASLYIRYEGMGLLPFKMMGEGAQRCLDIAVSMVANHHEHLTIDEIENGLHHTVLGPLWNWIAKVSARSHLQVFATTHSEECVQAACRVFSALQDDGLRVIRLDKREHETTAAVYDRDMVAAAERMGVEIRG